MAIIVQCDCGKRFKAKDSLAGKRVRCPGCQNPVAVAAGDGPRKGKPGPTAEAVDAEAALLKYEAATKKKQEDAAAEAARQEEKNKLIASYDQFAGRKKKKGQKKGEFAEQGVKKATVATKAADAGGTVLSNPLVKYLIIAGLLGAGAFGSTKLVQYIVTYTDQEVTVGPKPEERVAELYPLALKAALAGKADEAQTHLEEILSVYPDYKTKRPRDYDYLVSCIEKARKSASGE